MQGCETEAVEVKPVSVGLTEMETRKMCFTCSESYSSGAQHGEYRAVRDLLRKGFDAAAEALNGRPISPEQKAAVLAMDPNDEV